MVHGQRTPVMRVIDWELPVMRRTAVALGAALLALNILDILVTDLIVVQLGGFEANPLIAPMIGTQSAMLVKVAICVGVIALATRITRLRMVTYLRLAVFLYLVVTTVNIGQVAYMMI